MFSLFKSDGDNVEAGDILADVRGSIGDILKIERTLLNFLQRMGGVATLARKYVNACKNFDTLICPTRKTPFGFLDKKACLVGVRSTDLRDNFYIEVIHLENIKSKGMCSTAIRTKDSLYRINGMSGGPIWVITNRKKPKIFLFGVQSYYIEESPRKVGFTRVKKFLDIL
jgi:nicotinate-nucleotide pyrophosphorylase